MLHFSFQVFCGKFLDDLSYFKLSFTKSDEGDYVIDGQPTDDTFSYGLISENLTETEYG